MVKQLKAADFKKLHYEVFDKLLSEVENQKRDDWD